MAGDGLVLMNRTSLLRYLFPQSVRDSYRERLIGFQLDTLPDFKHRLQHRVYRFILERQRRRREQSRLFDRARRLLLGPRPPKPTIPRYLRHRYALQQQLQQQQHRPPPSSSRKTNDREKSVVGGRQKKKPDNNKTDGAMSSYLSGYGSAFGIGSGGAGDDAAAERGSRRRRLQAAAGRVYSAGAAAVNEIKESYNQTRLDQIDTPETAKITIPGSFPDVKIMSKGNEQLVLFPSYAKRHVKGSGLQQFNGPGGPPGTAAVPVDEEDFWRMEWAKHEDERAIVDVDVRGWLYNPHKAPMSRRNRLMIGLARQLSGIPAPTQRPSQAAEPSLASIHQQHEDEREQARISQKAQEIERRGQGEKEVAQKGGYSEAPRDTDSEDDGDGRHHLRPTAGSVSPPGTPVMGARRSNTGADLNDTELAVANANLMARLGPFLTTPLADMPITVFFYNDVTSQSRTVITSDSGHFVLRAALEFVPTHVRILANEDLNCEEPVTIIEPKGISLISDIDDTIKHSSILSGTKEIFRNTFVRDLKDLTVQGVKEWYGDLHDLGVRIHYCSNSPWQLFPVIASYFKQAGLPPGSIHLKQYSGMLQGIFEPVAERKKGTLEKILNDFPDRKFLLVGDSGEADLEVYADVAESYPGRILGVFIRDVTTPEQSGYFDSAMNSTAAHAGQRRTLAHKTSRLRQRSTDDGSSPRPVLPPRYTTEPAPPQGPVMGDLIDLSDEPAQMSSSETRQSNGQNAAKKPPPPRPAKPVSLKSSSTPPPPAAKPSSLSNSRPGNHPLAQMHNSSQQSQLDLTRSRSNDNDRRPSGTSTTSASSTRGPAPPPPPPRRRGTPNASTLSLSPNLMSAKRRGTGNSDVDSNMENLPAPSFYNPSYGNGYNAKSPSARSSGASSPSSMEPVNKKLELWRRRLERAQERLEREGVALYTWRRGEDVIREADGLVRGAMREMGIEVGKGERGNLNKKAHEG
ncbi:hypothetical protein PG985_015114 [Apiospora marii]|uniref:uncharacterized protein n=1 Tax=Apiospora marii TaxID=335849 RepID=UPI00313198AC